MLQADRPPFVHRPNRDGTIDSICSRCVVTVANARYEFELHALEQDHFCDPKLLDHWRSLSQTNVPRKP